MIIPNKYNSLMLGRSMKKNPFHKKINGILQRPKKNLHTVPIDLETDNDKVSMDLFCRGLLLKDVSNFLLHICRLLKEKC